MLDLDDATSESLSDLLAERILAVKKAQKDYYGIGKDMSAYDSFVNRAKTIGLEYDEKIAALLGTEKFVLFSEFETTLPQRVEIRSMRADLEFSGEPLSVEQEIALLPAVDKYLSQHPVTENSVKTWARIDAMSVNIIRELLKLNDFHN